jgi:hypothetical protein
MTREAVKALSDEQLQNAGVWVQEETQERQERRKREAIAKIKAIAAEQNLNVAIKGVRGRPAGAKHGEKGKKAPATGKA